jgi:hypothetical protein
MMSIFTGEDVVNQPTLKRTSEDDGLERVVHAEVETTVDNDTNDGGEETTVETGNTVGGEGLLVDVNETVELALASLAGLAGRLGVVGETSTGIVERVDEEERGGTGGTTRRKVTGHPPGVTIPLLLPAEERLEVVLEGEVKGLGGEVTDDVGGVTTPDWKRSISFDSTRPGASISLQDTRPSSA